MSCCCIHLPCEVFGFTLVWTGVCLKSGRLFRTAKTTVTVRLGKDGKKVWKWNNYCRIERILSKNGTNVTKQLHFYAQKLHLLIKKR